MYDPGETTIISPTGKGVRVDRAGDGHFGTRRRSRSHNGVDWLCERMQRVKAPHNGLLVRPTYPYQDDLSYSGVLLAGNHIWSKLWYLQPLKVMLGTWVQQGEDVGVAQDIRERYPEELDMQAHIHHRIERCDPLIMTKLGAKRRR